MSEDTKQQLSNRATMTGPVEVETISPSVRDTITYQHTLDANGTTTAQEYFAAQNFEELTKLTDGGLTLGKVIGRGGMGVVHEAIQQLPGRTVAVKKLYRANERLSAILMHEAGVMGSLEHPNIVPVHIVRITEPDNPEVVMKRIEGQSLLATLDAKPARGEALRRALEALRPVCQALEFAHSRGVVHRDVKPENIMLGSFGQVYLLDWGIAVRTDRIDHAPKGVVGTPGYMAPEMLSGYPQDVDNRTDVFLLGATLHEILTGKPRHESRGPLGALSQATRCVPYEYDSTIPNDLATLANAACALNPSDRPPSITEFRTAIERHLERWEAGRLEKFAQEKLSNFAHLIAKTADDISVASQIRQAFSEARLGFEQVLHIHPDLAGARLGLQTTILMMVEWLMDIGHLAEAEVLYATAPHSTLEMDERLQSARENEDARQKEAQRLLQIANEFDRAPSQRARRNLILFLGGTVLATVIGVLIYDSLFPKEITPKRLLFTTGSTMLVTVIVTIVWRRSLFANQFGAQLVNSIVFGLVCAIGFTVGAVLYDFPGRAVLMVDIFIASLAMANARPVIPQATYAAIAIFIIGILGLIWPRLLHPGLIISMLIGSGTIIWDWFRRDQAPDTVGPHETESER
ncbi:MAG: serine/threonine-protein kinase [Myxococcota bacterium]|nr:serine/threonine-protein kinase [Myxococcota bacterium]